MTPAQRDAVRHAFDVETQPLAFLKAELVDRLIASAAGLPRICAIKRCRRAKCCFGGYGTGDVPCLKQHQGLARARFKSALKRLGWDKPPTPRPLSGQSAPANSSARRAGRRLEQADLKMFALALFGMMVAIVIAQIPALRRQWLEDRAGAIKSWRLLAYYFLYLIVGVVVLAAPMRHGGAPDSVAFAAGVFFIGWLLLGVSWLIKLVPKYKPVAAWLLKPVGPLDIIAYLLLAGSLPVLLSYAAP